MIMSKIDMLGSMDIDTVADTDMESGTFRKIRIQTCLEKNKYKYIIFNH